MSTELPRNCELVQENGKTFITFAGKYVVTKDTGQRKFTRGVDATSLKRATAFAWSFVEGYKEDNYEIDRGY